MLYLGNRDISSWNFSILIPSCPGNSVPSRLALEPSIFGSDLSISKIVFSSSATVYGDSKEIPIKESSELFPNNPYGQSKKIVEDFLKNLFILIICTIFLYFPEFVTFSLEW